MLLPGLSAPSLHIGRNKHTDTPASPSPSTSTLPWLGEGQVSPREEQASPWHCLPRHRSLPQNSLGNGAHGSLPRRRAYTVSLPSHWLGVSAQQAMGLPVSGPACPGGVCLLCLLRPYLAELACAVPAVWEEYVCSQWWGTSGKWWVPSHLRQEGRRLLGYQAHCSSHPSCPPVLPGSGLSLHSFSHSKLFSKSRLSWGKGFGINNG